MPGRTAIVANPASSRGRGGRRRSELERLALGVGAELVWTTCATPVHGPWPDGSAAALAAELASEGFDVVGAAGGDGTLGSVLNGLAGSESALAVLPMGTGNDFARCIGIKGLEAGIQALRAGKRRRIDTGLVGGRLFLNIAGCGFDAEVAHLVNTKHRRLQGTFAYLAAVLEGLRTYRAADLTLTVDGQKHEMPAMLCAIANATSYGGGMKIAPNADLSDGLFDVVVIKECSVPEFLRALPSVFWGGHVTHPKAAFFRGSSVRVESSRPLLTLADGEEIGHTPAEFVVEHLSVEVVVP